VHAMVPEHGATVRSRPLGSATAWLEIIHHGEHETYTSDTIDKKDSNDRNRHCVPDPKSSSDMPRKL
jgi:hypothetical protein